MRPQADAQKPMNIQARPATVDDAVDACNVVRGSILACCHDDHRGDETVIQGWLRNKTPEFFRGVISEPNAFSVVASVKGETVGFGSALNTGEVTLCYAVPSVRFAGVGKALLAAIEDQAVRAGVEALRLESTRTARTFYLRNGFMPDGLPVQAFGMEALPMKKLLRPRAETA